jgi:peptide deformylase
MSILKIARIGHPVVRQAARPLTADEIGSAEVQRLIDDMQETMYDYEGVGVAAPQVHVGLRLAVLEVPASDDRARSAVPFTVLVNPVVKPLGKKLVTAYEGCLSVPDLRGPVPRHERIELRALDREGKPFEIEASGFHARVIQHECDHLDGGVYLDRMTNLRHLAFLKEFEEHVLGEHDHDE